MSIKDEKTDNESYSKNFTRTPNVLFVAYPDLSREEKYLYINLRRIYWDMKPRFVSLRELSAATHYASSALSKMLPHLNDAALIHAEIRREKARNGREKGNPKYYITIVDIWEVNRVFYSCSQKEQDELAELPSAQLVHKMNDLVHEKNKPVHEKNDLVSFREQDQAQIERAKDIIKDTSKDPFKDEENSHVSIDNATLTQLQNENASLKAELEKWIQIADASKGHASPTTAGQNDTPLTPAGRNNTVLDGGNPPAQEPQFPQSSALPKNTEPKFLDNAIPEPPNRQKTGSAETQGVSVPHAQDKALLGEYSVSEMPLTACVEDGTSNQATEQPQQANSDDPIATGTIENPPAPKRSRKPRVPKPPKPKISPDDQVRIAMMFDCLDAAAREALKGETGEESDFAFSRPDTDRERIYELLQGRKISQERVHLVFMEMWNTPAGRDGFLWKEHMSVASFCRNYDKMLLSALGKRKNSKSNQGSLKVANGGTIDSPVGQPQLITTGPLAGQPDYESDPWS